MPKVSEEQERLTQLFAGTWRGQAKLHPSPWDPNGGIAFDTWIVRASLDGFCVLVDYHEERDGRIVYRGHGVHGWDAKEGAFLVYWFDNMGAVPKQANRARLEGQRYTYESAEGPMGKSRFIYAWERDRFDFNIDVSSDGGKTWAPMHEGRYTRA